ncbi:MAG: ABC transporter ATP-binding protein [Castellaniella sp.]
MLKVSGLTTFYGQARAIDNVSLEVDKGEVVAIIGSNGAGKTTTLRTISNLLKPASGSVEFAGKAITGMPAHLLIGLGLAHVPEGRHLFPQMTVRENLLIGTFGTADWADRFKRLEEIFAIFPRLGERLNQYTGTLSGGERQMVAVGRALMGRPELIMLDEPSLGLAPKIVGTIFETLRRINEAGTAILLVEQNAQLALRTAKRAYLMENGSFIKSGDTTDLLGDESVRRAYLGI